MCSLLILESFLFLLIFSIFTNFILLVFMIKQLLNQCYIILTGRYGLITFVSSSSHDASRSIMSSFDRQDYVIHLLFSCSMKASLFISFKELSLLVIWQSSFQQEVVAVVWYGSGASKKELFVLLASWGDGGPASEFQPSTAF